MYCSVCGYKDWSSTSVSLLLWDLSRLQRSWCWLFKYGAVYFHHFYEWVKSVILSVIKHSYQFHQFEQSMSVPVSSNDCRLLWSTVIYCSDFLSFEVPCIEIPALCIHPAFSWLPADLLPLGLIQVFALQLIYHLYFCPSWAIGCHLLSVFVILHS